MPIYEYRCEKGHTFEVVQKMSDDPVAACAECGAPVERVFHPVAVHFKGSGFYTTDYARKGAAGDGSAKSADKSSDSSSDSSGEKDTKEKTSKKSDGEKSSSATSKD